MKEGPMPPKMVHMSDNKKGKKSTYKKPAGGKSGGKGMSGEGRPGRKTLGSSEMKVGELKRTSGK